MTVSYQVKKLETMMADLALLFLGQHLWSLHIACNGKTATGCLCRCCRDAREAFKAATGEWPTTEQENVAMAEWATNQN